MKKVVLHIGFHKTASTWWQRRVFPLMKEVNFIFKNNILDIIETPLVKDKINLISYERFSGYSHNPLYNHDNRIQLIRNIAKIYPNAKVLLCIRNKDDWLRSAYKQFSYSTWAYSFEEYKKLFDDRMFDYDSYINELKKIFPKGVYVFSFEKFLKNKKKIVSEVCKFLDCKDISNIVDYSRINEAVADRLVTFFWFIDNYLFKSRRVHTVLNHIVKSVDKRRLR